MSQDATTERKPIIFDDLEIGQIALELDDQEPQDVITWGLETFSDHLGFVTSFQVDGMAIIDMAYRIRQDIRVITVDTGRLRRDQWASRSNIRKVELDHDHHGIVKINPLADWAEDEVWEYLREHEVPTHPLYQQGFTSLGCAPCTRPIHAGEDHRAGRWWWEKDAPKECGIYCPIETGGFEHEVHAILGDEHESGDGV